MSIASVSGSPLSVGRLPLARRAADGAVCATKTCSLPTLRYAATLVAALDKAIDSVIPDPGKLFLARRLRKAAALVLQCECRRVR